MNNLPAWLQNYPQSARSTQPVLRIIHDRLYSGSLPERRTDGRKLALVIEGGGMRGVVAGGMVSALSALGLREVFDMVVGTSAGALAGAYFLSGQAAMGTSIYYEDLLDKRWLNFRRPLRRKPLLDLSYLLDEVMETPKPLDWEAILTSKIPLIAVATNAANYRPAALGGFQYKQDIRAALEASARIPMASGGAVRVGDNTYFDGSLTQPIPFETAFAMGATDALVLLTRPPRKLRSAPRTIERLTTVLLMNLHTSGLGSTYALRAACYADELRDLQRMQAADSTAPQQALSITISPHAADVPQLCQNQQKLFAGAVAGARAVHLAFTGTAPHLPPELWPLVTSAA